MKKIILKKDLNELLDTGDKFTREQVLEFAIQIRKLTISEYSRKVTASVFYDTSDSDDGRDGFHRSIINYPNIGLDNIEIEAKIDI